MAARKSNVAPAASAEASQSTTAAEQANAIEVVAKCDSFRRAGRAFTRETTTILLADLADGQLELLENEPMLSVQPVQVSEEE